jgi:flagellar basal-body rod protein FlgG
MWISNAGMAADEKQLDIIANNMANMNTPGFKFSDAYTQELNMPSVTDATSPVPSGTYVSSTDRNYTQGEITTTGNPLDLAVQGNGFFQVVMPDDSIAYTRSGNFGVDANGQIVTKTGEKFYPQITVPENTASISVSSTGVIAATMLDGTIQNLGQIELANFNNPRGLESAGDGLFKTSANSGDPIVAAAGTGSNGQIMQGSLENSNVDLANEMIKMMMSQKSYELNAKVMQTADQMMTIANGIKR